MVVGLETGDSDVIQSTVFHLGIWEWEDNPHWGTKREQFESRNAAKRKYFDQFAPTQGAAILAFLRHVAGLPHQHTSADDAEKMIDRYWSKFNLH
jgi:hypothetical protein